MQFLCMTSVNASDVGVPLRGLTSQELSRHPWVSLGVVQKEVLQFTPLLRNEDLAHVVPVGNFAESPQR